MLHLVGLCKRTCDFVCTAVCREGRARIRRFRLSRQPPSIRSHSPPSSAQRVPNYSNPSVAHTRMYCELLNLQRFGASLQKCFPRQPKKSPRSRDTSRFSRSAPHSLPAWSSRALAPAPSNFVATTLQSSVYCTPL